MDPGREIKFEFEYENSSCSVDSNESGLFYIPQIVENSVRTTEIKGESEALGNVEAILEDKPDEGDDDEAGFLQKLKLPFATSEEFLRFEKHFYSQREELQRMKSKVSNMEASLISLAEENTVLEQKLVKDKQEIYSLKKGVYIWKQKAISHQAYSDQFKTFRKKITVALKSTEEISEEDNKPGKLPTLSPQIQIQPKASSSSSSGLTNTYPTLNAIRLLIREEMAFLSDPAKISPRDHQSLHKSQQSEINSKPIVKIEQTAGSSGGGLSGGTLAKANAKRKRSHSKRFQSDFNDSNDSDSDYHPKNQAKGEKKNVEGNAPLLTCRGDNCGKIFTSKAGLRQHEIGVHGIKYIKKEAFSDSCPHCGRFFTNRAVFEGHKNSHEGIRPFKCPDCSYTSSFKGNIMTHQKNFKGRCGAAKKKSLNLTC